MILALDVGNTNIVLGGIEGDEIRFSERLSTVLRKTSMEYAMSIKSILDLHQVRPGDVTGSIISSVVPPITGSLCEAIRKLTDCDPLIVGPGMKSGLNIRMDQPAQVGADLIAAAVAAIAQYPCPVILIDMGTATTITVVDEDKSFIGGMILPGLAASLESLTSRTSQLPRISLDPPKKIIGKNTEDCMKSGILYGNASCLDGMIDRIGEEMGVSPFIVATGGLSHTVVPLCRHEITIDDDLLLKGLMIIYHKNCG